MLIKKFFTKNRPLLSSFLFVGLAACGDVFHKDASGKSSVTQSDPSTSEHVYLQSFWDKNKSDVKIYSVLTYTPLDIDYNTYTIENPWLKNFQWGGDEGNLSEIERIKSGIEKTKDYLENTSPIRVIGDYRFGEIGALFLVGTPTDRPASEACTYIIYQQNDDGGRVITHKITPTITMVDSLYVECKETEERPTLETVTPEDRNYYFKNKCGGLCKEENGLIYQNKLPRSESHQFQKSLIEHLKGQITDFDLEEWDILKNPRIVVFGDKLFVLERISRGRSISIHNLQFKRTNGVWEYENHGERLRTLDFVRMAEGFYDD